MTTPLALWPEDVPVPLSHPEIPPAILQAVMGVYEPCDALHRTTAAH